MRMSKYPQVVLVTDRVPIDKVPTVQLKNRLPGEHRFWVVELAEAGEDAFGEQTHTIHPPVTVPSLCSPSNLRIAYPSSLMLLVCAQMSITLRRECRSL